MRIAIAIAALSVLVVGFSGTSAQQPTSPTPVLTALDYLEIEQLVYRYGYALDTGADNGSGYADLYADDATFTGTNQGPSGRTYQGRERLAALARGGKRGPNFMSHWVTNVVIEPVPGGAIGKTYVGIFDIGNGGNGAKSRVDHGGLYNDVYVKTPQGWRFKSRSFFESTSGASVQPSPAMLTPPRALSASPGPQSPNPESRIANSESRIPGGLPLRTTSRFNNWSRVIPTRSIRIRMKVSRTRISSRLMRSSGSLAPKGVKTLQRWRVVLRMVRSTPVTSWRIM